MRLDKLTKEREWKSNLAIPFRGVSGFRVHLPRRNGGRVTRLNVAFLGTRRRERREGRSLSPDGDVDGSRR